MINILKNYVKKVLKSIELSKINFLNHKFRKFIVKYEINKDKIKIYNSNGDYKIIDNTVPNKVKIMEIVKDHEIQMNKVIDYYDKNKDDYRIIIMSSSLFLIVLGFLFIFSFFVGNYLLFIMILISFIISFVLYTIYLYKTLLYREEVKRFRNIKNNILILDNNELLEILKDSFTYIKNYFYIVITRLIKIFDSLRVKFIKYN